MGMRMEALLPRPWALTKSQNQSLQPSTLWQAFPTLPNLVPARKSQLPRLMQQSALLSFQLLSDKCILCQRLPPPRCRRVSRNSKMIHRTAKPISRLSSTRVETQGSLVTRLPTLLVHTQAPTLTWRPPWTRSISWEWVKERWIGIGPHQAGNMSGPATFSALSPCLIRCQLVGDGLSRGNARLELPHLSAAHWVLMPLAM